MFVPTLLFWLFLLVFFFSIHVNIGAHLLSSKYKRIAIAAFAPFFFTTMSNSSEHTHNSQIQAEREFPDNDVHEFTGPDVEKGIDNSSNSGSADYLDGSVPEGGDEMSRYESHVESSRTLSRRMTGADELLERAATSDEPLPPMGGGRPYPPPLPSREQYTVLFDGPEDPLHPHNYTLATKLIYSGCAAYSALCLTIGSAMFSQTGPQLMEQFHIGTTVSVLTTSLYVCGFATGPILFGPLSELFGRKIVLIPSCLGYTCFSFAVATAKDIQTIMICRFFAGFIGGAPLVVSPAIMADLFLTKARGKAIAIFAMVLFGGPMMAPILSGFTVKNLELGWRWVGYFCGITGSGALVTNILLLAETHHPLILVKKAEELRRRTGNWGIVAPHEEVSLSMKEIVEKNISRPLFMLFTEPILFAVTCYNAFIYGMLYLFLTAIPLVFAGKYHFVQGVSELPYISMLIGILAGGFVMIFFERKYGRAMDNNGGKPVPEERLPPMMIGGFFFAAGLFWLGWSGNYPDKVHWMVPTVAASFVGFGLILIFLPCLNYIIDCYLFLAASALAANTFLRSMFGAAFPLFARQMFQNLGINWALTLLGCLTCLMIPVPFLFYAYGKRMRERSKFAFVL